MAPLKKVLIIVGTVIATVGSLVALVLYLTSGLTDVADKFFQAASTGDDSAAYGYMSKDSQATLSQQELMAFLRSSSLVDYQDATWTNRKISNGRGTLSGTVTTESGAQLPITMRFVKEDGDWKIYFVGRGYYLSGHSKLSFELGYIKEALHWKLVETSVSVRPIE